MIIGTNQQSLLLHYSFLKGFILLCLSFSAAFSPPIHLKVDFLGLLSGSVG